VYAKVDGPLTYRGWIDALRHGRSYVSDGRSHLMNFSVNGREVGTNGSEVQLLKDTERAHVTINAAAYLDPIPRDDGTELQQDDPPNWAAQIPRTQLPSDHPLLVRPRGTPSARPYDEKPYWHIERARIGPTREVPVELVVNGRPAARQNIVADGSVHPIAFDVAIPQSSWVAVRILPSSHSNPMFVIVDGKPIRASRASAQWCLAAVNQCWTQKAAKISKAELPEAQTAYEHARQVYRKLISECER
jgi:hypothetical protein